MKRNIIILIITAVFLAMSPLASFYVYAQMGNHEGHHHEMSEADMPMMHEVESDHHHKMGEEDMPMMHKMDADDDVGICPVMRGKANKNISYEYKGKTYYFCCPMCIEQFKADPEKYISKIKEIKLEAYQFGFSPDPIVVKKDDIVRLYATSRDVPHGVYIKEYGINVPVKKGEVKKIEFVADKAGQFDILCSVYCGPGHHSMKAKLIVQEDK